MVKNIYICIARSFLVINVFNQGKASCSPCLKNNIFYIAGIPLEIAHTKKAREKCNQV